MEYYGVMGYETILLCALPSLPRHLLDELISERVLPHPLHLVGDPPVVGVPDMWEGGFPRIIDGCADIFLLWYWLCLD
jgi:hypothetical protein